jgi:hypothetical protein
MVERTLVAYGNGDLVDRYTFGTLKYCVFCCPVLECFCLHWTDADSEESP